MVQFKKFITNYGRMFATERIEYDKFSEMIHVMSNFQPFEIIEQTAQLYPESYQEVLN